MTTNERVEALFGEKTKPTLHKQTEEQVDIVATELQPGESLVIEAGAGTGKTTCMIELARSKTTSTRILYICFNNKAATEARDKFHKAGVSNTKACTIHALATEFKKMYEAAGKFQTKITIKDIQKYQQVTSRRAWEILETVRRFCESDHKVPTAEDLPKLKNRNPEEEESILKEAQQAWTFMIDPAHKAPLSYDHYLKVFALTEPQLGYDYILLDEAQDSNPLTISLLKKQEGSTRIVLIGDTNQTIYAWRGAKDAIATWEAKKSLPLTESFRFGKEIAAAANIMLKTFGNNGKSIKGRKPTDSIGPIPLGMKHTLIARTNATLFEEAISQIDKGRKYHFVGTTAEANWDPSIPYRFSDAKDVWRLYVGDRTGVRNPHIQAFDSYAELKSAAVGNPELDGNGKVGGDKELASLCRAVEKHGRRLPEMIAKIVSNSRGPDEADILLTTAHRSKGLEWPRVKMADDFATLVVTPKDGSPRRLAKMGDDKKAEIQQEDINLIYVAITRAQERLEPNAKTIELFLRPDLLPEVLEIPIIQPAGSYIPSKEEPKPKIIEGISSPIPTLAPIRPLAKATPTGTVVKVSYQNREHAKDLAKSAGGRLSWDGTRKTWLWHHSKGAPPPKGLGTSMGMESFGR